MRGKEEDFVTRLLKFVTFTDMPIQRKFLLFSSSVALWIVILSAIGLFSTDNEYYQRMILIIAFIAITLLLLFSIWIAKSFTRPINAMIEQVNSLNEGITDYHKKIEIFSDDELGELSKSFNRLLENFENINTFKKVIEEDDSPEDIYMRLGGAFHNLELDCYQIYEVSNSKNNMKLVNTSFEEAGDFCSRDILVNCNLCRAKKTGGIVSSVAYPDICKHFARSNEKLSHICVPMSIGDSTGGIVQFIFDPMTNPAVAETVRLKVTRAQRFIKEALPVLEAKRLMSSLRESSLRDPMTGLYNRRFLEEYTETLIAMTQRRNTVLGLLMCDIDFFKEVNDTYGHNVGDQVLKRASELIRECVRASDMVIRFGGEEFLAVLHDMQDGDAEQIAEKIRANLESEKVKLPSGFIQKTISIGVSEFPKDTANFWQSIKFADIALYKAKDSGRNKVIRFTKDMWSSEEY